MQEIINILFTLLNGAAGVGSNTGCTPAIHVKQKPNQRKEENQMNKNETNALNELDKVDINDDIHDTALSFRKEEIDKSSFAVLPPDQGETIRETTTTDTTKLFNAATGTAEPVKSILNKVIEVTDIVVTSANVHSDKNDEDSPMQNRPVVHFYTTDGKHYSSLSNGIVRTTKALLECGLCPTPENPIKVRFKPIDTKKGTAHIFELA